MKTVYILLEKNLETETVRVESVYATRKDAERAMSFLMDFNEERRSYKIDEKGIVQ